MWEPECHSDDSCRRSSRLRGSGESLPLLVSTGCISGLGGAVTWLPDPRDLATRARKAHLVVKDL